MNRLLFRLSTIVLPVGALICLFNYFVDPANIFTSKKYVAGIAAILSQGHNVDQVSNYNERLLQEQMVRRLSKTPDIIILGSSRIMEIGSDFFPGKKVLNCGVSHANVNDLVALTGLLDSLGRLPAELYINLDPDLISEKGTSEWQSLSAYYDRFINRNSPAGTATEETGGSNEAHKIYSLVSFAYFKESVNFLIKGSTKKYYDVGSDQPPLYGRFSDGSICYPASYTHPDTLKIASDALRIGSSQGLFQPDSARMELLGSLIDFLNKKNVRIHFIMLPFHPAFYQGVNNHQPGLFNKYEKYFRNLASQKRVSIKGDFDATALHIPGSSFYDMYHCSKAAIQSLSLTDQP
ncbi:MAG TPA: hypothetical protein VGM24_01845 [Puia sp.]